MEKIKFKELLFESLDLLKLDKRRFGIILFVMVFLGILVNILNKNPILSVGIGALNVIVFIVMSIMSITIVKHYYETNEVIETGALVVNIKKNLLKSIGLMLTEGVIIVLALIVFLMPLALILVIIGPKLGNSVTLVTYFVAILFAIPLIIVNIMISFSLQFFLIKKLNILDSIKSSYFLVKDNFKNAMSIGIKINFFYYILALLLFKVNLFGAIITSGLGIVYILMTTFTYYRLNENYTVNYEV